MAVVQDSWRWIVSRRTMAVSVAAHLLVLAALLLDQRLWVSPATYPGDAHGHRIVLTFQPGFAPAPAALAAKTEKAIPPPPIRSSAKVQAAPAPAISRNSIAPAAPTPTSSTGSDALGSGNVTVALVVLHPPPDPDLSQLPHGTRGDVIVDVVIDDKGHIVKSTMEQGVGHGVDETVLATIQQWTFQPATRNGVPVASEQELLFHYERG
jgi:protein TonB